MGRSRHGNRLALSVPIYHKHPARLDDFDRGAQLSGMNEDRCGSACTGSTGRSGAGTALEYAQVDAVRVLDAGQPDICAGGKLGMNTQRWAQALQCFGGGRLWTDHDQVGVAK